MLSYFLAQAVENKFKGGSMAKKEKKAIKETSWANARVKLHSQVHFGSKKTMVLT